MRSQKNGLLSEKAIAEIRALMARYPVARSALGPALYVAQREVGWLPPDVMAEVARFCRARGAPSSAPDTTQRALLGLRSSGVGPGGVAAELPGAVEEAAADPFVCVVVEESVATEN